MHRNARLIVLLLLGALSFVPCVPARAQDLVRDISSEYARSTAGGNAVGTLGDDLFGDETSLYTGQTQFRVVDVALPGNDALAVELARRFVVEETQQASHDRGALANWDLDVPYLSGLFTRQYGWQVDGATPDARCDAQAAPRTAGGFSAGQFWYGNHLHLPGGEDQELLVPLPTSPAGPPTGGPYRWVTHERWVFACLPSLKNADAFAGQGFLAISPDGVKYWFDWMATRDATSVGKPPLPDCMHTVWVNPYAQGWGEYSRVVTSPDYLGVGLAAGIQSEPCPDIVLQRSEVRLYATRVEDRFGNHVDYTWSGDRLVRIEAGDGRAIAIAYGDDGYIASASTGAATWTYRYADHQLAGAVLPDGSAWSFASNSGEGVGAFLVVEHDYEQPPAETNTSCMWPGYGGREFVYTITHPSGAVGEFRFAPNRITRTLMPKQCIITTGTAGYFLYAPYADLYSIFAKKVWGPGSTPRSWTFAYEENGGGPFSFQNMCTNNPQATGCIPFNITRVTRPDGAVERYTFGNRYQDTEGRLLETATLAADGQELRRQANTYVASADLPSLPFADRIGVSLQGRGAGYAEEAQRPLRRTVIIQDGIEFSTDTLQFDAAARAVSVRRASSPGQAAVDDIAYVDNTAQWVLGQVRSRSTDGIVADATDYDAMAQPVASYAFGALRQRLTHAADGTLASVRDGAGNTTVLSGWRRGVPQAIAFADGTSVSAVVDNLGHLASRKDAYGSTWTYTYDALGRPRAMTPPSGDGVAWNPTTFTFAPVAAAEYGIPAGHWRRTVQTGTGRTTEYYDAGWRLLLTVSEDTANAATRSFVVHRYDASGLESYVSYPAAALATINDALPGTRTFRDALGRVTRVERDSEQGVLATTTEYLAGGAVRVTNANGKTTTTQFQMFDRPDWSAPTAIALPAGVSVAIVRDVFGKPLAVTRSGPFAGSTLSATRRYVYDANQRICKAINPESGADVFAYDAAGNLAWSAPGTALTGTACDRDSVPSGARVARGYDALNRLKSLATPDGNGNLAYAYTLDGLVASVTATNPGNAPVTTAYTYNKRRLLTAETASQPNWYAWTVGYGYDANASLATVTYPNAVSVAYAPNALGQATQVGAFASGVTYFPNGAVKQFTFGNGIVHQAAQNTRGLPSRLQDRNGAAAIVDDTFAYDPDGNPTDITDQAQAGATTRGMAYDDLDRLSVAVAPGLWGTATYTYDPLDNLRTATLGAAGFTYAYDAGNRLVSLARSGGGSYAYQTDARGNITSDGRQAYVFDQVNRLGAVAGKEAYRYDGLGRRALSSRTGNLTLFVYDRAGQVLYTHDSRRNQRTDHIYLGDTLVAEQVQSLAGGASTVRYVHTDFQRTPVARTDAGRTVVERTSYAPYGAPLNRPVEGVAYTGHVADLDTGLLYTQQRYMDPSSGRFLSVDPDPADPNTASNFNRYAYAADNPYGSFDPDGRAVRSFRDALTWSGLGARNNHPGVVQLEEGGANSDDQSVQQPGSREDARVYAKEPGEVVVVGWQNQRVHHGPGGGAGFRIQIRINRNQIRIYGHMDPESVDVARGDNVEAGQFLGNYANPTNGHSSGPHVHDQLMDFSTGRRVDVDPNTRSPLGADGGHITTRFGVVDRMHPNPHQGTDWVYGQ